LLCAEASAVLRVGRPPRRAESAAAEGRRGKPAGNAALRALLLRSHGMAGRSLLNPEPAAELRRVDNAGDAGPDRHEQPRNLRAGTARAGSFSFRPDGCSLRSPRSVLRRRNSCARYPASSLGAPPPAAPDPGETRRPPPPGARDPSERDTTERRHREPRIRAMARRGSRGKGVPP